LVIHSPLLFLNVFRSPEFSVPTSRRKVLFGSLCIGILPADMTMRIPCCVHLTVSLGPEILLLLAGKSRVNVQMVRRGFERCQGIGFFRQGRCVCVRGPQFVRWSFVKGDHPRAIEAMIFSEQSNCRASHGPTACGGRRYPLRGKCVIRRD
jgi:hypothetical protein